MMYARSVKFVTDGERSLIVALLGDLDLGRELGKPGTRSDITLYDSVGSGVISTYVEPTQFPEKLAPLLAALAIGDRPIVVANGLNRDLGEIVLAVDLMGRTEGLLALGPGVGEGDLQPLLKGTSLQRFARLPRDAKALREAVLNWPSRTSPGEVVVPIDHAFPVKGVGTVVLGVVRQGTLHVHDKLRLYPSERMVEARSLQVHDVDLPQVESGSRVGVALKGVEAEDISRGEILAPEGTLRTGDLLELTDYRPCRFFKGRAGEGDKVHVSVGLQTAPARIQMVDGPRVQITVDRPLAWLPGDVALLVQLSSPGPGPRLAGRGILS